MTTELLDRLASEEFQRSVGQLVPPQALRVILGRNRDVKAVAEALATGTLTEENVETFVAASRRCDLVNRSNTTWLSLR